MYKCFSIIFLIFLIAWPVAAFSQERNQMKYAPGEVLVKFRSGVTPQLAQATHRFFGTIAIKRFQNLNIDRIKIPKHWSVEEAIYFYSFDPDVEYAEPNYIRRICLTPNDPDFDKLWGLHNTGQSVNGTVGTNDADIDAPEAWETETGSSSVVIAVLDTGADWNHVDLSDNIWSNSGEIPNNLTDDDNNGYVDDVRGWDFVNSDNDPSDDNALGGVYHGTHVSGTIAAEGNNGIGISGVCWSASIMPLKILDHKGEGFVSDIVDAISYAIDNGAKVINMSFSAIGFSASEYNAIENARDNGVLVVAAAGNSGENNDILLQANYPASYNLDNIISVAATNQNDLLASFSNYGPVSVDVAAPGVNIYSTRPGNGYQFLGGTSMATPHVSGIAALIWSAQSGLTYAQVKDRILNSVDVKSDLTGKILTWGRVNAGNNFLPSPPTNLAVTPVSFSQIDLSWTDNSSVETGFRIERKMGSMGNYSQVATVGANVTSYSDIGLDEETTYYYRVAAYISSGNSSYSNEVHTTTLLAAPTDLSASATAPNRIYLSWTDNSSAEEGFRIERKYESAGTYSQVATVNANVTSYYDGGLRSGTLFYYRVRAYKSCVNSAYSNEASAMILGNSSNGGSDSRCFIATAVYGAADHPHVRILRGFRDTYLLGNSAGSLFVDLYYRYGPSLADVIEPHKSLRILVRFGLMPIVLFCTFILYSGPVEKTVLCLFVLVLVTSLYYRRYHKKICIRE